MKTPPKIRLSNFSDCSGEQLFQPTPPEMNQNTRPLSQDDCNGKTLFDLQTEHALGYDRAANDLERFAISYQAKQNGTLERSAANIETLLNNG